MTTPSGDAIQRDSLHERVVQRLGQRIVGGEYRPGDVLPREDALAEQLAISRTALREALKVLSAKGLVEAKPAVGTRVRAPRWWHQLDPDVLAWRSARVPTEDYVAKLIQMREMVEPMAAGIAAEVRTTQQLAELDTQYSAMANAQTAYDWAEADVAFHHAVLQATNNELIVSLFAVVASSLATFLKLSAQAVEKFNHSLPLHQAVVEAIRDRRPRAAVRATRRIITQSRNNMRWHAPTSPSDEPKA